MKTTPPLARHLLVRAGYGARPREIQALVGQPWERAVKAQLDGLRTRPVTKLPDWSGEPPPDREAMMEEGVDRAGRRDLVRDMSIELKGWWINELVATPSPLTERLTLLWSNHFTSSLRKVRWPPLLLQQNLTLRSLGSGSFKALLKAVTRDPAMIVYLDNQTSHKDAPNENFARELLELFTLGEGHYTERDIKEAARAFTGYRVNRATGAFRFASGAHDDGVKTFLGRSGRFDGDGIVETLLEVRGEQVATFIAARFWREFIADEVDPAGIAPLAATLRRSGWAIRPLLEALFTHKAFVAEQARGTLLQSPVELFIGALRTFDAELNNPTPIVRALRRLGQDLFDPPNVKGWPGGTAWITTNTLLLRYAMLEQALGARPLRHLQRPKRLADWLGAEPTLDALAAVLTAAPPVAAARELKGPEALKALVLDPVFQLR